MEGVAARVRDHLDVHPTLGDAVREGIANHSAIARRVAKELGTSHVTAVLAACRRYPRDTGRRPREDKVRRVLLQSRITTRTKIGTITVALGMEVLQRLGDIVEALLDEGATCRLIQVSKGTVLIVDEDSVPRFTRKLRESQLISIQRGLGELSVSSPDSIEDTPGLLALLTTVLSSQGINIVQAMSCYTDTIFILRRDDLNRAVDVLARIVG
jgi:hypothetical protein